MQAIKKIKATIKLVSVFLNNGLYYVRTDGSFVKLCFKNIYFLFFILEIVHIDTKKKIGPGLINNGTINQGANKVAIITGELVYLLYKTEEAYTNAFNRYEAYYSLLTYPKPKIFEWSNIYRYSIMERVHGNALHQETSVAKLFTSIYENASKQMYHLVETIVVDGRKYKILYFVQHGDCGPWNIIIDNNNDYCFIDFDNIGLYPAFYDIFFYCSWISKMQVDSFLDVLNTLMESILKLYDCFYENYLDLYLSIFANKCTDSLNENNVSIVSKMINSVIYLDNFDYPLTQKAYKSFCEKLRIVKTKI